VADLYTQFVELPSNQIGGKFAAIRLSQVRSDFLAKDQNGAPIFLLHDESHSTFTPGVTLKTVRVQYHVTCQIDVDGTEHHGQFALISCDEQAPDLFQLFIRCVAAALPKLPSSAQTNDIEDLVRALLDLFRSINAPGRKDVVGFWAELFTITLARDTVRAVIAWHSDPFERFDFSFAQGVLEVKATQGSLRRHEFALEQLQAPSQNFGLIASFLLQAQSNGAGVMDLAKLIETRLGSNFDLIEKLWSNVVKALGSDFDEKLDYCFSTAQAEKQLRVIRMQDIPAPAKPIDTRIFNIRFEVDLTDSVGTGSNSISQVFDDTTITVAA
jgi:Putative  PD-(D/E)XK family member, (DUF4420)